MAPESSNPKDIERDRLDALISSLNSQVIEARSARNELSPIAVLPNELLCRIFETYQLYFEPGGGAWSAVTHVCRRWRHAAFTEPNLWSEITDKSFAWLEAYLERSRSAPATLTLTRPPSRYPKPILQTVLKALLQKDRQITLEVQWRGAYIVRQLQELWDAAEAVYLARTEDDESLQPIPPLRALYISNGLMEEWNTKILAPLEILHYSESRNALQFSCAPHQLIKGLASLRNVQDLKIEMGFPPMIGRIFGHLSKAALPSLRTVVLRGTLVGISGLLQHLAIPPSATVRIECSTDGDSAEGVSELATGLANLWDPTLPTDPDVPVLYGTSLRWQPGMANRDARISLFRGHVDFAGSDVKSLFRPQKDSRLIMDVIIRRMNDTGPALRMVQSLPALATVQYLDLTDELTSVPELSLLLSRMPELEEIVVRNGAAAQFVEHLMGDALEGEDGPEVEDIVATLSNMPSRIGSADNSDADTTAELPPLLRRIVLHGINLGEIYCAETDNMALSWETLAEAVMQRQDVLWERYGDDRADDMRVEFRDCTSMSYEKISIAQTLMPGVEIVWDGVEKENKRVVHSCWAGSKCPLSPLPRAHAKAH